MATPNIVPRGDSEGGLGTTSKYWAAAYIDAINTTIIQSPLEDGDLILKADNGSGAMTAYITLDGGVGTIDIAKNMFFGDSVKAVYGGANNAWELEIFANSSDDAFIVKTATSAGDLTIQNSSTDGDVIFNSDDGNAGEATYFRLDGGAAEYSGGSTDALYTIWPDKSRAAFGTGADFQFGHNGADSVITNATGDIYLINNAADKDIIFATDNMQGGTDEYLVLDGSEFVSRFETPTEIKGFTFGRSGCVVTQNDATVTHTADTKITVGMHITGDGIASGAFVASLNGSSNESFEMSQNGGGNGANTVTLTFSNPGKLTLSTANTDIRDGDIIGRIDFQAPNEATTGDAILVGATIHAEAEAGFTASVNSTGLVFSTGTTSLPIERMRIDQDGLVGIGTSAPDAKLSVTSAGTVSEDILYLKGAIDNTDEYLGLAFETNGGGNGPHGAIRVYNGPSSGDSHMSFLTTTDGGTLTKGLTIDNASNASFAGNVTLSSASSPSLAVTDTTNTVTAKIYSQDANSHIGTTTNHPLIIDTNNTPAITIDTSQNAAFAAGLITAGSVGVGGAGGTKLQVSSSEPYVTLKNQTVENTDHGCESKIIFEDHGDNALGQIEVSHEGTADDEKGQMLFSTNNDSGLQTALTIGSDKRATFAGGVTVQAGSSFTSVTLSSVLQLQHSLNVLNKAQSAYVVLADRDTSGSEVVYNLANVGTLNGIPFYSEGTSMYTHNVSATDGSSAAINNTAYGFNALDAITEGDQNTAIGKDAGTAINTGKGNTLMGAFAGNALSSGDYNVAIGRSALAAEDANGYNVAIGTFTLMSQDAGDDAQNVAVGYNVGAKITTGVRNSLVGATAGDGITLGSDNVALGYQALSAANAGNKSTAIGSKALAVQTPQFTDATCDTNHTSNTTTVGCDANSSIKVGMRVVGTGIDTGETVTITAVNASSVTSFTISHAAVSTNTNTTLTFTGGVDSNNTAVGYNASNDVTTGINNTVVGSSAGDALTSGSFNVAIGMSALSTEDANGKNVAVGYGSLETQNSGADAFNVAVGFNSGNAVTLGLHNTIVGGNALRTNQEGDHNTAIGYLALEDFNADTDGHGFNTAVGSASQLNATIGTHNTSLGAFSMGDGITTGDNNVAVGYNAGLVLTSGVDNTIIGTNAGDALTTGSNNIAVGLNALSAEDAHSNNIAIGTNALRVQDAGVNAYNVAIGHNTGISVSTGIENTLVGGQAGDAMNTDSRALGIGYDALTAQVTSFTLASAVYNNDPTIAIASNSTVKTGQRVSGVGIPNDSFVGVVTSSTSFELADINGAARDTINGSQGSGDSTARSLTFTGGVQANTAIGYATGQTLTTSINSTLIGYRAGESITLADHNTAIGAFAGQEISTGASNTLIGSTAGDALTTGANNIALGVSALGSTTTAANNVAIGVSALNANVLGASSIAIGLQSLAQQLPSGSNVIHNVCVGEKTGFAVTTGVQNTLIGGLAGDAIDTGDNNIIIGYNAAASAAGADNETVIGTASTASALIHGDTVTFSSANANDSLVVIQNTVDDASSARLRFVKTRGADGVDGDDVGIIEFSSFDDGTPSTQLYGQILTEIVDATSGEEGGRMVLNVATHDGSVNRGLLMQGGGFASEVDVIIGNGPSSIAEIAGCILIAGTALNIIPDLTPTFSAITDCAITLAKGTEYLVNDASGGAMVLPAATAGARITINIGTLVTSNTITITAASGDLLKGFAFLEATDAANNKTMFVPDGSDDLIITLNGSTKGGLVGDKIELVGISATEWRVRATLSHTGSAATPFS